jgi:hypothetical protein
MRCTCNRDTCSSPVLVLQLRVTEEVMAGSAPGSGPYTVHLLSVLNRLRFVKTLIPRIPVGTILCIIATQFYDVQRSKDLLIECVPAAAAVIMLAGG